MSEESLWLAHWANRSIGMGTTQLATRSPCHNKSLNLRVWFRRDLCIAKFESCNQKKTRRLQERYSRVERQPILGFVHHFLLYTSVSFFSNIHSINKIFESSSIVDGCSLNLSCRILGLSSNFCLRFKIKSSPSYITFVGWCIKPGKSWIFCFFSLRQIIFCLCTS